MLKEFGDETTQIYFICSGSIGVYEKRMPVPKEEIRKNEVGKRQSSDQDAQQELSLQQYQESADIPEHVLLNMYKTGQSVGDPEFNFRTPLSTRLVVTSPKTKVVALSRESFYQVFANKMNSVMHARSHALVENFAVFKTWNDQKIKNVCEMMKTRKMQKGEVLFEDQTRAELLYFLTAGSLIIEKEVVIRNENFWPVSSQ